MWWKKRTTFNIDQINNCWGAYCYTKTSVIRRWVILNIRPHHHQFTSWDDENSLCLFSAWYTWKWFRIEVEGRILYRRQTKQEDKQKSVCPFSVGIKAFLVAAANVILLLWHSSHIVFFLIFLDHVMLKTAGRRKWQIRKFNGQHKQKEWGQSLWSSIICKHHDKVFSYQTQLASLGLIVLAARMKNK